MGEVRAPARSRSSHCKADAYIPDSFARSSIGGNRGSHDRTVAGDHFWARRLSRAAGGACEIVALNTCASGGVARILKPSEVRACGPYRAKTKGKVERPIVLTSNKRFEEWGEIFGDEVMAGALIDRLLHHCHIVNIRGNSYRTRHHADLWAQHPLNNSGSADAPRPEREDRKAKGVTA